MHVLFLPSWYHTSQKPTLGSFFKEQALSLKEHGCNVGVIYPEPVSIKYALTCTSPSQLNDVQINTKRNRYFTLPALYRINLKQRMVQYQKLFEQYTRDFGLPDVLHAHSCFYGPGGAAGLAAQQIAQQYQIPFIITEHASAAKLSTTPKFETQLIGQAYRAANQLVCVSESLASILRDRFELDRTIEIIGNVVDSELFTPKEKIQDDFTFITVAHLRPVKRVASIISAFSYITEEHPKAKLLIVGDGEDKQKLKTLCESLKLKQVKFIGDSSRETVAKLMQSSDCYVNWSEYETFSVAVHEALSCGLEVISSPCEGPEYVVKKLNGKVAEDATIDTLTKLMFEVLKKTSCGLNEHNQRHAYIDSNFSRDAIAQQLIREYNAIVK